MTTDEALWMGAAFTLLGALIGAGATLLAARYTWRRQHFNEAAAHFRAAFVETIFHLRREKQDVHKILTPTVLAEQERALISFSQFLSDSEQRQLNSAWIKYNTGPHTNSPGSLNRRISDFARAQSNIENLLRCAKPK